MDKKRKVPKQARRTPLLYVRQVKLGWLRREIHLAGEVEAVIDYNCRVEYIGLQRDSPGSEAHDLPSATQGLVRVNGLEVGPLRPGLTPSGSGGAVGFELRTGAEAFPAEVRAELSGLGFIRIRWLEIVVAGVTLYEERDGKTLVRQSRSDLPMPAAHRDPGGELPIPGEAGEGEC